MDWVTAGVAPRSRAPGGGGAQDRAETAEMRPAAGKDPRGGGPRGRPDATRGTAAQPAVVAAPPPRRSAPVSRNPLHRQLPRP
nr:zinc ribbon domain-containing protein [Nocardia brasiliensis]